MWFSKPYPSAAAVLVDELDAGQPRFPLGIRKLQTTSAAALTEYALSV
jgi:hypothetical protein